MLYPDRLEYKSALARLLAAAPDDSVRDPQQALAIIDKDLRGQSTTEIGETIAMALANLGAFEQAIGIQRGVLAAAQKAGEKPSSARLAANLQRYEQRQPSRQPWPNDQP